MAITSVFTNNRTQAVRIPAELRLPDSRKKVVVPARGSEKVITPVGQTWDSFFLNGPLPTDDFMTERSSQEQPARESL